MSCRRRRLAMRSPSGSGLCAAEGRAAGRLARCPTHGGRTRRRPAPPDDARREGRPAAQHVARQHAGRHRHGRGRRLRRGGALAGGDGQRPGRLAGAHPRRARPADPAVRHRAGHGPRGCRSASRASSGRSSRPAGSGSRRSPTTSAWPDSPPGPPRSSPSRWPGEPASTRSSSSRWRCRSARACGPSACTRASRPSSTSRSTRGGDGPRRRSARIPTWSRTVGTAYVRGLESTGLICTLKHFVGYSASRGGRNLAPAAVTSRQVADLLLPPFEMAIRLGGARSVMHAYTDIDGIPTAADPYLLSERAAGHVGLHRDGRGRLLRHQLPGAAARRGGRSGPGGRAGAAAGVDVELPTRAVLRRSRSSTRSSAERWTRRSSTGPRAGC